MNGKTKPERVEPKAAPAKKPENSEEDDESFEQSFVAATINRARRLLLLPAKRG